MSTPQSRPVVAPVLAWIGVLHLAAAPWVVGPGLRGVLADGVLAAVEPADPVERDRRSHAFWYLTGGLAVLVGAGATARLERSAEGLPRATAPILLGIAGWGAALVPVSGFWAFAVPAVLAARPSRPTAAGPAAPGRVQRVAVTDPAALARRHDYADAFEVRPAPDDAAPEQWVRAGVDAAPGWIKRIAGAPDGLGGVRVVESGPDLVVLEDSDDLMDTVMIGRNVEAGGRRLTTVLRYRRPVVARAIWSAVGVLHRRTARRVVTVRLRAPRTR